MEGYHTSLMKGRYPVCCLFLEMDPAAVDVNIHPAKREVKFHREAEVRRLVAQAVRQTLLEFHAPRTGTTTLTGDLQPAPEAATQETTIPNSGGTPTSQHSLPSSPVGLKAAVTNRNDEGIGTPRTTSLPAASLRAEQRSLPMGFGRKQKLAANGGIEPPDVPGVEARKHSPDGTGTDGSRPPEHSMGTSRTGSLPQPTTGVVPLLNVPLRLVGVIGRLYVVLESDRGLVLLDQHAAHERILFEEMLTRLEKNDQAPSQKLLLPATLELSARDANFVREQLPVLARLGVGLSEFGERTFLLDALPPFVKASDPRRFVLQMIDELKAAGQEVNTLRLGEQMVAKTVCRHAVKANDPLAGPELEKLIQNLRQCAMPYTCPHGRPTLIEMNFRELEKKFGRTA
jgi:DNA mismatch repair protein MutL